MSSSPIRIGVIGLGVVGRGRARTFANDLPGATLAAVCDSAPAALEWAAAEFGEATARFERPTDLWPHVDAVMIATPHPSHPSLAIEAFEAGKHVLIEKPAGVTPGSVRAMNAAAEKAGTIFGIHFQHRYQPVNQLVHDLIHSGEIGEVRRINWTITTWFRSQHYFNTGGWRATWEGEGGGVLLNQAPHQLDLWQWFFGMPETVQAFCQFGRFHDIETEDEATLFMQYRNGPTGVFITSTAENPGTDRLEITADRGRVVVENGEIRYQRTKDPVQKAIETTKTAAWGGPTWEVAVDVPKNKTAGNPVARDFVDAIQQNDPSRLRTPGASGLHEAMLACAALQSSWEQRPISLPQFDDARYESLLQERIAKSTYRKSASATPNFEENY